MITFQSSLAQIIAELPQAAGIFESLGIDYCCGGSRSLELVCGEKKPRCPYRVSNDRNHAFTGLQS